MPIFDGRVSNVPVCGINWRKSFEDDCRLSDMENPSHSKVDELKTKVEQMNAELEELKEHYGVEDEDDGEEVFIPAGGRTNHGNGVGSTAVTGKDGSETETKEVEIPAAGRPNDGGTTVEREVPADTGMEAVEDFRAYMNQSQAEEERRKAERRKKARKRRMNNGAYTLDDSDELDTSNVPAGGRSNWEKRQEE